MLKKKPTFIDLFSGGGGLSLGLQQAGFQHVLGVEIDPKQAATYKQNIGKVLIKDVAKLKPSDLPDVDLIAGGPPCQGFSSANRKIWNNRESDPRQKLIFDFAKVVLMKRPKAFLMENAPTLLGSRFKTTHLEKFKKMLAPKYDVRCSIKDLGEIGHLPQKRKRTICTGVRKND